MRCVRPAVLLLASLVTGPVCPPSATAQCLCGTAADDLVADRAGLVREWVVQLPFDSSRFRLEHVVVGDGIVVAQTGDGLTHAIQAARFDGGQPAAGAPRIGTRLWSTATGRAGMPAEPAGVGPRLVTVSADLGFFAIERETGKIAWQEQFGGLPAAGPFSDDEWVYIPLGGNLLRLPVDRDRRISATPAEGAALPESRDGRRSEQADKPVTINMGSTITYPPRSLPDGGVFWCNDDGVVVTLTLTDLGWVRDVFDLLSATQGEPVLRGTTVFAATRAGELARIEIGQKIEAVWRQVLPRIPDAGPFLSGDTIVVSVGEEGILACSAETGAPLWWSRVIGTIVAVSGDRVWLFDRMGTLTALDVATGQRRERLCLGGFTVPIVNRASDRLIIASSTGVVAALAPRRSGPARRAEPAPTAEEVPAESEPVDGEATDAMTEADAG